MALHAPSLSGTPGSLLMTTARQAGWPARGHQLMCPWGSSEHLGFVLQFVHQLRYTGHHDAALPLGWLFDLRGGGRGG